MGLVAHAPWRLPLAISILEAPTLGAFPADHRDRRQLDKLTAAQRRRALRKDRTRRRRLRDRIACDPTVTATARSVYGHLLRYSDDSAKEVYVRNVVVAAALAICERTVQRCTAELEALGYLKKILRPVSAQRNASNLYYFSEPSGPVPQHHPLQRRRYRIRRLHRATPASGGTFSSLNQPAPSGAPARLPGQRGMSAAPYRRPAGPTPPRRWSNERSCEDCESGWLFDDVHDVVSRCACSSST